MSYIIVAYSSDGEAIGAFDTYKRAEYYIVNETSEQIANVTTDEVTYRGA
jgi:hypothetical protein